MKNLLLSKRTVSSLLVLFALSSGVNAAPRSVEQARNAAARLLQTGSSDNVKPGKILSASAAPQLVYSKEKSADEAYYYVFSKRNGAGYAIISGDDRMPAVVGYSSTGTYNADNLPENMVDFMQAYQNFVDNATDEQIQEINDFKARSATTRTAVEPFLTSKWNQGAPYNNMCPVYDSQRCVTGCVATAVAQVLYYYKKPVALMEDISGYTTLTHGISMKGISAGEKYDWDNMLDVYDGSESDEQNDAVAKLMLHIGCALGANYSISTGASITPNVLTDYFGMDKELVRKVDRIECNLASWDEILYSEMAEKRPVLYSGRSTGGGHEFVIDGYKDGMYYVNWGWGGYCDGYFDITILNPGDNSGTGASSTEDGYTGNNSIIIGLTPDNGVVDKLETPVMESYRQLSVSNAKVANGIIGGDVVIVPLNRSLDGQIYVSVGYKDEKGIVNICSSPITINSKNLNLGYYFATSVKASFPYEEGTKYELCMIESEDGKNWKVSGNDYNTLLIVSVEKGKLIINTPAPSISATDISIAPGEPAIAGVYNKINVTLSNAGDKDYYKNVFVKVTDKADETPADIMFNEYAANVTVVAGETKVMSFNYRPTEAGTYYFWILGWDADGNLQTIGQNSISFAVSEDPILSIESIKCVNGSKKKVYAPFDGYDFEMDEVKGTKADFVINIKNDGGFCDGEFWIYNYIPSKQSWSYTLKTLRVPANTTTSFPFTVEGNVGEVAGIMIDGRNVSLAYMNNNNYNYKYGNSIYTTLLSNCAICYLAGDPDNISSAADENGALSVSTGVGCITVKANADSKVVIASAGGALISTMNMTAGQQTTIALPAGMYIINKMKVIVK